MFVYYYVHLALPLEEATAGLKAMTGMQGEAEAAYQDGEDLRARLSTHEGSVLAKEVRLTVGTPRAGEGEVLFPITWLAVGTPGLFPQMEADLLLTDLGPDLTQLTFRGTYRPPFGSVGRAVDRTLLHRLAETCVKSFVDRTACALTAPADSAHRTPPIVSAAQG
jgi:hypothetical protein